MTKMYVKAALLFLITLLCIGSCICGDLEKDNPLDPGSQGYVKTVLESGLAPNALVTDTSLTIVMDDPANLAAYHYQIDNGAWQTVSGNLITLTLLDEGAHTFRVKMENTEGNIDDSVLVIPFTVDAVHGPALMIKSRRTVVTNLSQFDVQVMMEELEPTDSLTGANLVVICGGGKLRVRGVRGEPFLVSDTNAFVDSSITDTSVYFLGKNLIETHAQTGTGALITIRLEALATGTAYIRFDQPNSKVFTRQCKGINPGTDKPVGYYQGVVEIR